MLSKLIRGALAVATIAISSSALAYEPLKEDPKVLNFGFISTESSSNLKKQWEPFLEDMEKALGMEVEAFFAPDYAGVIEGMRFGKVHIAWYGNKSGMEAVDRAGGEIFVQQTNADGSQGYHSHVIVPVDSSLQSLNDLLKCDGSLNFGLGDPNSTSGFLVPSYYVFAKNGVDPQQCFRAVRNANHETNFMATANKQVHAAANNSEMLGRMRQQRPEIAEKVRVIWTSPLIPSDPMVYRTDLSQDLKDKIRAFFLSYGRIGPDAERQRQVMAGIGAGLGPFTNSSNAQLYPIRQLALFKEKVKVQGDQTLSEAERVKRVKELEGELETLSVLADNVK